MQPPPGYLQVSSSMMAPDVLPYRSIEPPHGRGQHRERRRRHDSHSEVLSFIFLGIFFL